MIKAVLLDFDGTLVTRDILDILTGLQGKAAEAQSEQINRDFHAGKIAGLSPLIARINLLRGLTLKQIDAKLGEGSYLMPGAGALTDYLHDNGIISILTSGNIQPALEYYQRHLKLDYVFGSRVRVQGGVIEGISVADYPGTQFKLTESRKLLEGLGISAAETCAIGDSPGDRPLFEFAGTSIAINPKGGIEKDTGYVIHDDLSQAITIIDRLRANS